MPRGLLQTPLSRFFSFHSRVTHRLFGAGCGESVDSVSRARLRPTSTFAKAMSWSIGKHALNTMVDGYAFPFICLPNIFPTETYVACQCASEGGFTICEENANAKAPSANHSHVDAQRAYFKKRREAAQAARDAETAAKSI